MKWDGQRKQWVGGLVVRLPYMHSQDPAAPPFGVPNNLHVIGTMNTADRSIALLDTALRRRFVFRELLPDPEVIKSHGQWQVPAGNGQKIDLVQLLEAINERIEFLYDRDHRIGHSYFLGIKTYEDLERVFLDKIIPLLQEYFYGDWEKIQFVFADLEDVPDQTDGRPKCKNNAIISHQVVTPASLLGIPDDTLSPRRTYAVPSSITPDSIIKIYER